MKTFIILYLLLWSMIDPAEQEIADLGAQTTPYGPNCSRFHAVSLDILATSCTSPNGRCPSLHGGILDPPRM